MERVLKVLLPPVAGFAILFIGVFFNPDYPEIRLDSMGEGTLRGFMSYYVYFLPLLFLTGLLTQLLIATPIWNWLQTKGFLAKAVSSLILCLICISFAVGIGYLIWDQRSGLHHLVKLCLFMTLVQLTYWVINILVLLLLTDNPPTPPEGASEVEDGERSNIA